MIIEHKCNEDGTVYESSDEKRFYFDNSDQAKIWYNSTKLHIVMGSVCCSICESALIDIHFKEALKEKP